jgi:hypothetical protein
LNPGLKTKIESYEKGKQTLEVLETECAVKVSLKDCFHNYIKIDNNFEMLNEVYGNQKT